METDLAQLIGGWDYDPKDFPRNVRRIWGIDGREKIQLRSTCQLALGEHMGAIRDIEHNIAAAELLSRHAPDEGTRTQFRQLLPHLILERTRAEVVFHVGRGEATKAAREIERAIGEIVGQLRGEEQGGQVASSSALAALQEMAEKVRRTYLADGTA